MSVALTVRLLSPRCESGGPSATVRSLYLTWISCMTSTPLVTYS
jgi:hypothetical protein